MEPPLPLLLGSYHRRHTSSLHRRVVQTAEIAKNSFMSSLKHKISALMCRISREARQEEVVVVVEREGQKKKTAAATATVVCAAFSFLFWSLKVGAQNCIFFFITGSLVCVSVCVRTCVCVCLVSRMRFNEGRKNKTHREPFFSPLLASTKNEKRRRRQLDTFGR
jgi:hypothetical protein